MHLQMGSLPLFSQFTAPKLAKTKGKKKIQASGGLLERSLYAATLWNTLEGTAKRAEKDRERFSGSTHASPSSKFCA